MPQNAWSAKCERQYMHIKDSLIDRCKSLPLAEEIAACVSNEAQLEQALTR